MVEQDPVKVKVVGSNPAEGAFILRGNVTATVESHKLKFQFESGERNTMRDV